MFYTNCDIGLDGKILYRGIDSNGERVTYRDNFNPTLFLKTDTPDSKYKLLDGTLVSPMEFSDIPDARDFVKKYKDVDNFDIFGMTRYQYQYISNKFKNEINWDFNQLKIFVLDIEIDARDGFPNLETVPAFVTSIAIKDMNKGDYYIWGYGDYDTSNEKVHYTKVEDEEELFESFIDFWSSDHPDIITGWNISFFDIPYLIRRARALGIKEKVIRKLSPWNRYDEIKIPLQGRVETKYQFRGITTLDYMDLYKKFSYTARESYALNYIAKVEIGKQKTDEGKHTGFNLFQTDHQQFIDYNIGDVDLVGELDNKLKLIKLICTMAYSAKCNYDDVFSQVRTWDCIIYNYLLEHDIVIPFTKKEEKKSSYAGAYVKDVSPGLYEHVVSFDIASLYPNIIRTLNIGPETFVTKLNNVDVNFQLKKKDFGVTGKAVGANGAVYRTDEQSIFSQLVEKIYNRRVSLRTEMMKLKKAKSTDTEKISNLDVEQYALKIQLNSLYGAIGNQYFRYFDVRHAEAITLTGQTVIQWVERAVNKELQGKYGKVFYCDTDSIFVTMKKLIDEVKPPDSINYLDKFCKKVLEPCIEKSFNEYCDYVSAYKNHLVMKREAIGDKGIWTAKKRYMLNIHDNEGIRYDTPELKIMGIESVRSSTPECCRDKLKETIALILNEDQSTVQNFIKEFKDKFKTLGADAVAFPRSINGVQKYEDKKTLYKKSTPIHVRGSLLYNKLLKKAKLEKRNEPIKNGDKIKFCYLKPNRTMENVISFKDELPKELEMDKYIDYDLQFAKAFEEPLTSILNARKWQLEQTGVLPI